MKKWVLIVSGLLIVFLAGIFLLIPSRAEGTVQVLVAAPSGSVYRSLVSDQQWKAWWPGTPLPTPKAGPVSEFQYEDRQFTVQKVMEGTAVTIRKGEKVLESFLRIIPAGEDSTLLQWSYGLPGTANPFIRLGNYFRAQSAREDLETLLAKLKGHLEKEENLYGFNVQQEKVKDTIMVVTRTQTDHFPDTSDIYRLVRSLQVYIAGQQAQETNYPMLHISREEEGTYGIMVAIPVNRVLPEQGTVFTKRMVAGDILVAEVRGGLYTTLRAMQEMENYVLDHKLASPAIPFELLVTDRSREPDTTRWITRIYYPIY
ncbi:MAG TPA: GyrI-like domain-containing protein [Chitinophagaceae bacterium]|jgi:hypothetical protein|nr:GyrI-like domain-containing protein [Chitinophagaceae bacterium]